MELNAEVNRPVAGLQLRLEEFSLFFLNLEFKVYCLAPYNGTRLKLAQNGIFNNNGSLSPTLAHFYLTNKEVEVMIEII